MPAETAMAPTVQAYAHRFPDASHRLRAPGARPAAAGSRAGQNLRARPRKVRRDEFAAGDVLVLDGRVVLARTGAEISALPAAPRPA